MKISVFILFISLTLTTYAQTTIGSWQEYIALNDVFEVESIDNKIVSAAKTGIFIVDTDENVLKKLTKINGLNDVAITAMKSIPSNRKIIIGYSNGNIDIIEDGDVTNIPDLKLKQLTTTKSINNISIISNLAFCATDFGILVVDYEKNEISDTYYIADNAESVKVNHITTYNDSIFAAADNGLYGAPIDSDALSFYDTWVNVDPTKRENLSIAAFDDFLGVAQNSNGKAIIKTYSHNEWSNTPIGTLSNFKRFVTHDNSVSIITSKEITTFNTRFEKIDEINSINIEDRTLTPNFSSVTYIGSQTWIGDSKHGLIQKEDSYDYQYLPDGPASNNSFKIVATQNYLYSVRGVTHELSWTPAKYKAEFSILTGNSWKHVNQENFPILETKFNFCDIAIDPNNENKVFIASARNGIFSYDNHIITNHYTYENSTIQGYGSGNIMLINSLVFNEYGDLYAANQAARNMIVGMEKVDSTWFSLNYLIDENVVNQPWIRNLTYDENGRFWATSIFPSPGLFLFDTKDDIHLLGNHIFRTSHTYSLDSRHISISLWDENGDVLEGKPKCLAKDKNGYMWVGTSEGPIVYYRPNSVFQEERPIASRIKIPRDDGSGLADYLLEGVDITAIKIDGANRKWFGTNGSGVYLVSSDGTNTLEHFTTENSPLLTNFVNSIAINPSSGEVFFATTAGIVSYRGTAIEGKPNYSNIYAFPNPVKPNYEGNITIKGLKEQSTVKITDISGKIVYQAVSTGGQLIWNGRNMYNDKVKSGVYIVFATNEIGEESVATKIMIVR